MVLYYCKVGRQSGIGGGCPRKRGDFFELYWTSHELHATSNIAQRNYSQTDEEELVLEWGIRKFNHYLHGRHFTLVTDHQPLTAISHSENGIQAMTAAARNTYEVLCSSVSGMRTARTHFCRRSSNELHNMGGKKPTYWLGERDPSMFKSVFVKAAHFRQCCLACTANLL